MINILILASLFLFTGSALSQEIISQNLENKINAESGFNYFIQDFDSLRSAERFLNNPGVIVISFETLLPGTSYEKIRIVYKVPRALELK
jgi:hypothetical protein